LKKNGKRHYYFSLRAVMRADVRAHARSMHFLHKYCSKRSMYNHGPSFREVFSICGIFNF